MIYISEDINRGTRFFDISVSDITFRSKSEYNRFYKPLILECHENQFEADQ